MPFRSPYRCLEVFLHMHLAFQQIRCSLLMGQMFWRCRQGNDSGSQYRSQIAYHNDEQKAAAEKAWLCLQRIKLCRACAPGTSGSRP